MIRINIAYYKAAQGSMSRQERAAPVAVQKDWSAPIEIRPSLHHTNQHNKTHNGPNGQTVQTVLQSSQGSDFLSQQQFRQNSSPSVYWVNWRSISGIQRPPTPLNISTIGRELTTLQRRENMYSRLVSLDGQDGVVGFDRVRASLHSGKLQQTFGLLVTRTRW